MPGRRAWSSGILASVWPSLGCCRQEREMNQCLGDLCVMCVPACTSAWEPHVLHLPVVPKVPFPRKPHSKAFPKCLSQEQHQAQQTLLPDLAASFCCCWPSLPTCPHHLPSLTVWEFTACGPSIFFPVSHAILASIGIHPRGARNKADNSRTTARSWPGSQYGSGS